MKTPNDAQTPDMLPDGWPAFDLDPEHPWPMPKAAEPKPETAKERALEPFRRWLEKMAVS